MFAKVLISSVALKSLMRSVFIVTENEQKELKNSPFQDEVRDMQKFFKDNIKVLGENFEFIAESINVTVGGTYREIDILALDTEQRVPVIIELGRDTTLWMI